MEQIGICPECRKTCAYCNKKLTKKNLYNGQAKAFNYTCKTCVKAREADAGRAGKRKCARCKTVWNRSKEDAVALKKICPDCRTKCSRCNIVLTEENQDHTGKTRKQYRCKKCVNECVKNSRDPTKQKEYDLIRNYGITINEYEAILESQGGVCYICQRPPTGRRLSVDHKHQKGDKRRSGFNKRTKVRGLLCWQCNGAIGKFRDTPAHLRRAAEYLETWPAQKVLNEP
jgi:hypothetical protein